MAGEGLEGLILYTDVWRSGEVRYLSNFIPYWNQGLLLIPRQGESVLVTGLSARVHPWIRETSSVATVATGPSIAVEAASQIKRLGWKRIGVGELTAIPHGILADLRANLQGSELRDATELLDALRDDSEPTALPLYRKAREILGEGLGEVQASLPGKSGWQAAALLERAFRRRGATDTVILLAPGAEPCWPAYPSDDALTANGFVILSVEYKGHWVEIGRPLSSEGGGSGHTAKEAYPRVVAALRRDRSLESVREEEARRGVLTEIMLGVAAMHRSFPSLPVDSLGEVPDGSVIALHLSGLDKAGRRSWWGETLVIERDHLSPLLPGGLP